jgi:predicted metal-binding protein
MCSKRFISLKIMYIDMQERTHVTHFSSCLHTRVPEAMDTLFDLLEGEKEHAARIVLGRWLVGYGQSPTRSAAWRAFS